MALRYIGKRRKDFGFTNQKESFAGTIFKMQSIAGLVRNKIFLIFSKQLTLLRVTVLLIIFLL